MIMLEPQVLRVTQCHIICAKIWLMKSLEVCHPNPSSDLDLYPNHGVLVFLAPTSYESTPFDLLQKRHKLLLPDKDFTTRKMIFKFYTNCIQKTHTWEWNQLSSPVKIAMLLVLVLELSVSGRKTSHQLPSWINISLTIIKGSLAVISGNNYNRWIWVRRDASWSNAIKFTSSGFEGTDRVFQHKNHLGDSGVSYTIESYSDATYIIDMDFVVESLELLDGETCDQPYFLWSYIRAFCTKDLAVPRHQIILREFAKGYKKSSRVGFANLSSGIDLYICPRSDPIITILAKYGFFKGMTVIDDKPDSMIGCVVWRKNRPVNPVGNTSEGKSSPDSIQLLNSPPGFSIRQCSEKKLSSEMLPPESSQHDKPLTVPLTTNSQTSKNVAFTEIDHEGANYSSSSSPLRNSVSSDPSNLVEKRPFMDDDLPEFDFGISSGKSTLVSQHLNPASSGNNKLAFVNCQKLDSSLSAQLLLVNGSLEQSSKRIKLFEDDDDDMPEWCPPKVQHQMPSQSTNTNFQTLPSCPPHPSLPLPPPPPPPPPLPLPLRPIPPPSRADTHSSFSYQPFRPAISSLPPTFVGPPPLPPMPPPPRQQPPPPCNSSGAFSSNQVSWHQPGSFNVNLPFPPSNGRHSQP